MRHIAIRAGVLLGSFFDSEDGGDMFLSHVGCPPTDYTASYTLTPRSSALLGKPPVAQLLKKFPTFYGTRRFTTVFTRALHWSLS
jgi:hypothetical protein